MKRINKSVAIAATALAAILVLTGCGGRVGSSSPKEPEISTAVAGKEMGSTTPTPTEACPDSWEMDSSNPDNEQNRWYEDGIVEIREAKTDKDAREAFRAWLLKVQQVPAFLKGAYAYIAHKDVDPAHLVTSNGCATKLAVEISVEIRTLGAAAVITPDQAPANGTNSGVDDGTVVSAPGPGITGDTTAIKIVLPDGTVIWIMARCGNVVTLGPPPYVPPGHTDEKIQNENIDRHLDDPFWQNGGETNQVSHGDDSSVANGYQGDEAAVAAAQKAAADKAAAEAAAQQAAADKAAADAAAADKAAADANKGSLGGPPPD